MTEAKKLGKPRRDKMDISDIDGTKPVSNIKPLRMGINTKSLTDAILENKATPAGSNPLTQKQLRLSCVGYNLITNNSMGPQSVVGSQMSTYSQSVPRGNNRNHVVQVDSGGEKLSM